MSGEDCVRTCGGLLTIDKRLPKLPTIDLAPNPPTGNGGRNSGVSSLPALQSTPNFGSGVSIVAITPRTPRSTTTTSTTTIGIASTKKPLFNVNTILPNVIDDSREIKEEIRSQSISNRQKQTNTVRVRPRKVRVRQRKRPKQDVPGKYSRKLYMFNRSVLFKDILVTRNLKYMDCRYIFWQYIYLFVIETSEPNGESETTSATTARNLSSRLGQWNSKDTRSRLRDLADERLRANSLSSKSISSAATPKATTTTVESRGEEGLIGQGSEPEHTQIRTQTSRSIVMRRSRIKQQKEGSFD